MSRIRTTLALFALLFSCIAAIGCNTVEGVGKDIEALGKGISGTSEEVRDN